MNPFPFTFWQRGRDRPRRFGDTLEVVESYSIDRDTVYQSWGDILAGSEASAVTADADELSTAEAGALLDVFDLQTQERNTAKAWGDILAGSEAGSVADADQLSTAEAGALSDSWGRSTQERNTAKAWGDALAASEADSVADAEVVTESEAGVLSDSWGRTTQERNTGKAHADQLTISESDSIVDEEPTPPSSISCVWDGVTGVDINWTVTETGWRTEIQRKVGAGGSYVNVTTTAAGATSYYDVNGDTTHRYRLRHVHPTDSGIFSPWSADRIVTS